MSEVTDGVPRPEVHKFPQVLGPAIQRFGLVYYMPRPSRHHNVMDRMISAGVKPPITGEQGFMTSDGFMDRCHTQRFIQMNDGDRIGGVLTSEDLW